MPKSVIPEHFRDDFVTRQFINHFQSLNRELDLIRIGSSLSDPSRLHQNLSEALLGGRIIVAVDRGEKRHRLKNSNDDYAMDPQETSPAHQNYRLGPHDDGSHSFTVADNRTNQTGQSPKSLDECATRLQKARDHIVKKVYSTQYSDSQLEALAENNTVDQARFFDQFSAGKQQPRGQVRLSKRIRFSGRLGN